MNILKWLDNLTIKGKATYKQNSDRYWHIPTGEYSNLYVDMANQNHLLVAGATGSGKSVVLNGIISTLLYKSPSEVSFILVDPKMVELSKYSRLPHTIRYAETTKETIEALNYADALMMDRYQRMKRNGQTKYDGNDVYVIIDELADLLLSAEHKQVERQLQHITQLGRAAKIHLIAATQSPSRKTLPASFCLNMTGRVALRCDSAIESRQIIGLSCAEFLPRYGECYYKNPDIIGEPINYIVPMVQESEINRLIEWWKGQSW